MNFQLLTDNLTNPALLFFVLGILAVRFKSDLSIPENSSKFISLYLLFSIGFKGGQELAHSELGWELVGILLFGVLLAVAIPLVFALIVPLFNGVLVAYISQFVTSVPGDRFLFAILASSASYIAVPAAMRLAAPQANEGLYLPMALAITFPINITLGMPLYLTAVEYF